MNLEQIIDYTIQEKELYEKAFTHKSALNEIYKESNERLEFIGDSVLNLVIAQYLYEKYPQEQEGFLTRIRTKLVRGETLSTIGKRLNLDKFIVMNEKGMKNEWNKNPKLIENALESLIGAIYLDKGLNSSKNFIHKHITSSFKETDLLEDTNYKDIFMRYVQSRKLNLPTYKLLKENCVLNNKKFTVQVVLENKTVSEGTHCNKRTAEQIAAHRALRCFQILV